MDGRTPARAARCDDAVEPARFDDAQHGFAIADVQLMHRHVRRKARDIRPLDRRGVEVVEVVHHLDRMAEHEAPLDKVRANEASSARYEDFHAVTLSAVSPEGQGKSADPAIFHPFSLHDFRRDGIAPRKHPVSGSSGSWLPCYLLSSFSDVVEPLERMSRLPDP